MEYLPRYPAAPVEAENSSSQDALQRIVEVFRDGHAAAAGLHSTVSSLSPSELHSQLAAIEAGMLRRISQICDTYRLESLELPRH